MKRARARLPEVLLGLAALALVVRWTVRDRIPGVSTLFYATPLPVVASMAAAAALAAVVLKRNRWGIGAGAGCIVLLAVFFVASHRSGGDVDRGDLRGVLWNVSRGTHGWDRVAEGLRRAEADVAVVVEGGTLPSKEREAIFGPLTGGESRWFRRGMGLGLREGRMIDFTEHDLADFGRATIVRTEIRGKAFLVVIVDIDSNPLGSRSGAFEAVNRLLALAPPGPRLVLGDFNTPWESVHFDGFRSTMAHAFDRAGQGMRPTWPLPFPLLELDHVWGRRVTFSRCAHEDLGASDHRAVTFGFRDEGK